MDNEKKSIILLEVLTNVCEKFLKLKKLKEEIGWKYVGRKI